MLHLQSWFIEGLDRRVVQAREKMATVFDTTVEAQQGRQHASRAEARSSPQDVSDRGASGGAGAARAYEVSAAPADDDSDDFGD